MPLKSEEAKKAYASSYYLLNKEKIKNRAQEHYQKNKEHHYNLSRQYLCTHFEYQLYRNAKTSSKQRGLEFNLELSDIIIPEYCPYLNIKLTKFVDGGRQETNASLDRIDNTKGYIKGNVQVISSKANFMKRNATIAELLEFAKGINRVHMFYP